MASPSMKLNGIWYVFTALNFSPFDASIFERGTNNNYSLSCCVINSSLNTRLLSERIVEYDDYRAELSSWTACLTLN